MQSSLPHCRGIQSKLRKVRELPPSTRDASIMDFLRMVSLEAPHRSSVNENQNRNSEKKNKSRCSSGEPGHAETGKTGSISGPPIGPASALPVLPGTADYGPPPVDFPDDPARENVAKRKSGAVQILAPNSDAEEGAENIVNGDPDYYSTLSCWGMTNVSVLMLTKPDGKRDVAAIAPENTLGVTVRDEGDAKGGDATGTLRVGPIEVAITNKYEYESASVVNKDQENYDEKAQNDSRTNHNVEEVEPVEPFADRLGRTLTKTAENMRDNAKTVADVEFPRRMLKSSERIANEFGSTLQRTGKVAKSMFRFWSDDDDNSDGSADY